MRCSVPRAHAAHRLAVAVSLSVCVASVARAAGPEDRVRQTLDGVAAVLADPALQGKERETARRQAVSAVIRDTFDFGEMSRAALGTHWASLTPEQRKEFADVFGDVFTTSYERLVLRFLGTSKTVYGATSIEGPRATVRTTLDRGVDGKLPVDYQLISAGERWAMSDVVVDGISLTSNFRAQFDKTIRSGSYEELVRKLREKLARDRAP